MDAQPTCGQGLAEHSSLPAKVGELIDALAENLERHQRALDLTDENARKERDAYMSLASSYRSIASALKKTAAEMAGYRDLPMGRHDMHVMASPEVAGAFVRFVTLEGELAALLQKGLERDLGMLASMRSRGAAAG
jgi:hypothetical protein